MAASSKSVIRRLALCAAAVTTFSFMATPAQAGFLIVPLLGSIIGEAALGFSIFGITLGSALGGVITTPIGRGLHFGSRQ